MEQVILKNSELSIAIDFLGAELASIKDKNGVEHLWQGDASFWRDRAPILFPLVGGLKDDKYVYQGKTYELAKHGFVKKRVFELVSQTETTALLRTSSDDTTRPGYPFEFDFDVAYELAGNSLVVTFTINNLSDVTLYGSMGAHEGYSCPEGISAYELIFEQEEVLRTSEVEGNLIGEKTTVVLDSGAVLPLKDDYFTIDALVFKNIRSQAVTLAKRGGGRKIKVEFPGFPFLGIWTVPGAPYVCIEPWCGLPDETSSSGRIEEKTGILAVPARSNLARTHKITFDLD